jgi:hypothetical protein
VQKAVRDGLREFRPCCEFAIQMQSVVIAGKLRKSRNIFRCHGATYCCPLTDLKLSQPID